MVTNMPLFTMFGGAVCRMLKRWLELHAMVPDTSNKHWEDVVCEQSPRKSTSPLQTTNSSASFTCTSLPGSEMEPTDNVIVDILMTKGRTVEDKAKKMQVKEKSQSCENREENCPTESRKAKLHHCSACQLIEDEKNKFKKCAL